MEKDSAPDTGRTLLRNRILKAVFLYALFPLLFLVFLSRPVTRAVQQSDSAVFRILLAGLAAVVLNWLVYRAVRGKLPSRPAAAYGVFCLLVLVIVEHLALPGPHPLMSTLALIGGCLILALLVLLAPWLASRPSKPAHVFAVGSWIAVGLLAFAMVWQVVRDFEGRQVTLDTWISIGILAVLLPAVCGPHILSFHRRAASRRRATVLTDGRITRIVGETHFDLDGDPVTRCHAHVQYTVDDRPYETRVGIRKSLVRKYGRSAFIGRTIPVSYDPSDPANAYTVKIDKHLFDRDQENTGEEEKEDA